MRTRTMLGFLIAIMPLCVAFDDDRPAGFYCACDGQDDGGTLTTPEGDDDDDDDTTAGDDDATGDDDTTAGDDDDDDTTPLDDVDNDGDGFSEAEGDCDDTNPSLNPMATDLVGDDIDQNCDGVDGFDGDGDGYASEDSGGDDCDDTHANVYPGAPEDCLTLDNDCNGIVDDKDEDGDGQIDEACANGIDCDDSDPTVCDGCFEDNTDGVDNNCNGVVDQFSFEVTWSAPYEYWIDENNLIYLMDLTLAGTDLPLDGGLDFHDGYTLGWQVGWFGTTLGDDEEAAETIGESEYRDTWKLDVRGDYGYHCFAWGLDPATLDPNGDCIWEDPAVY
jgi:hypothetical protein